jgi:aconitate hydratase
MTMPTRTLVSSGEQYRIIDLAALGLDRLPIVHRVLIETIARRGSDLTFLTDWIATGSSEAEIAFWPGRVMMHDTTCGPALVDIAAARDALADAGGDPRALNPVLPVNVSTDHSLAVDHYGHRDAAALNLKREFARNAERYSFMKWASHALDNFTVHPPGTGIMHTINLEQLATVVTGETRDGVRWAVPDTLIGTDSHTPMINGIGVLGWGVGGLEAESVMFGMPVMMRVPEVIGVRLDGRLRDGVTATDLALVITHRLRRIELAGRFVEYFGPGVSTLSAGERAVIANMAPEYGSSTGYFPIDDATLAYLRQTGRSEAKIALVRDYARATGLWFDPDATPHYTQVIAIDLDAVGISLAGPRRPQDLVATADVPGILGGGNRPIGIAAVTSCTNTSDPRQLLAAGLVARKARALGLTPPTWVKTSLAPGSPSAGRLLDRAGLLKDLEAVGFAITGYGCTVCIGNSGPLAPAMDRLIEGGTDPVGILSGNRNFPGRVHPQITDAFLASPALVVAYALAGDAAIDIARDPIGHDSEGRPITLDQLWPSGAEIDLAALAISPEDFATAFAAAGHSADWAALPAPEGALYRWDAGSTYLRPPPFARIERSSRLAHYRAAPLIVLGDDITTDHISSAGAIDPAGDAAHWLIEHGADPADLNVFSSRRGNWEVMLRGLFTNRNVRNLLGPAIPPGSTILESGGEPLPLWRAAAHYAERNQPVVIVAGERYGMGSSRDWAAKGASLLGACAVLAASFERIHRSNLVNMGIIPLRLPADRHPDMLDLRPEDRIEIDASIDRVTPRGVLPVTVHRADGHAECFDVRIEVETALELSVLEAGGIIPLILTRHSREGGNP